jgi:hypothetical protein
MSSSLCENKYSQIFRNAGKSVHHNTGHYLRTETKLETCYQMLEQQRVNCKTVVLHSQLLWWEWILAAWSMSPFFSELRVNVDHARLNTGGGGTFSFEGEGHCWVEGWHFTDFLGAISFHSIQHRQLKKCETVNEKHALNRSRIARDGVWNGGSVSESKIFSKSKVRKQHRLHGCGVINK